MPLSPEYDHDHEECLRRASEHAGPHVQQHIYPTPTQQQCARTANEESASNLDSDDIYWLRRFMINLYDY